MSVQHILDVGSAAVPQDAIIRSCAWSTLLRYLKRKLVHPDNVIGVTTQLLSQTSATMHTAFDDLVGVAEIQHWTRPRQAVQFAAKYVASRFLWLTPLFETLQVHVQRVTTMQVTCLVFLLKLYLPAELSFERAMELNRFRRRVAKLVGLRYSQSWCAAWVARRWNYVGHVLRFEEDHITKRSLKCLHEAKGRGGPKQSLFTWACRFAASVYHMGPLISVAELEGLASDRQNWMAKSQSVQEHHMQSTTLYTVSHWDKPLRLFVAPVSWLQALLMTVTPEGTYAMHWVSSEHGLMRSPLPAMSYVPVSLQEVLVLEADDVARRMYSELSVVWLFEIVPQALYDHLVCKLAE